MEQFFVSIEGIDGAGKDTLAIRLQAHFAERHNITVILTEEPSDDPTGHRIRDMLNGKLQAPETNYEFQRLFVENRREHLVSCIRPHLEAGRWIISVRYWLSTLAYGMLEGPVESYIKLHQHVIGNDLILPDLTVLLDVEPEEGLQRIRMGGRHFDWFAKLEKLTVIRQNYLELARRTDLGSIAVVDAMQPLERVLLDVETIVEQRYLAKKLLPEYPHN